MRCYYTADASEDSFMMSLQEAALESHVGLLRQAEDDPDNRGMATTLTLFLGVWPWVYVLQVGDSRYYILRDGELRQITRDAERRRLDRLAVLVRNPGPDDKRRALQSQLKQRNGRKTIVFTSARDTAVAIARTLGT